MNLPLTLDEKNYLLKLARESIAAALRNHQLPMVNIAELTESLREDGACFVTLTIGGALRGCIGSLEAHQSLVDDVRERAVQAAFEDFRFPPLTEEEFERVEIEISRLTQPIPLDYGEPGDLSKALTPGVDGVILQDGFHRATFLPQVWQQLPEPEEFLGHLCAKMGARRDLWRHKRLDVKIYRVEEIHE